MFRQYLQRLVAIASAIVLLGCAVQGTGSDTAIVANSGPWGEGIPITGGAQRAAVATGIEARPQISNLQYGAVCGPNEARRIGPNEAQDVCAHNGDVQVTYESRCVYDRQLVSCTWYGYSFNYVLPRGNVLIQCGTYSSMHVDNGNPTAIIARDTQIANYTVELLSDRHRFFNPQYMASFSAEDEKSLSGGTEHLVESCSYMGSKLFEFALELHYPKQ